MPAHYVLQGGARMLENAAMTTSTVNYVARKKPRSRQRDWKMIKDSCVSQASRQSSHPKSRNHGIKNYQTKSIIATQDLQSHLDVVVYEGPLSLLLNMGAMITMTFEVKLETTQKAEATR
ncbi:unnamed protein product [Heligmosomoides polygyrus]|uniref:Gag-pol polyprotein n=1 Tax=Heligmosomoides polygyrus TaxID=6339 RepID=A0A183G419_HELPZ|nr:unnamed protein product [Heligmosomoides polygyrus]